MKSVVELFIGVNLFGAFLLLLCLVLVPYPRTSSRPRWLDGLNLFLSLLMAAWAWSTLK